MVDEAKNKMMEPGSSKTKQPFSDVTVKAVSLNVNEYHFPGAPDFQPISVRATSIEEADQLWKTMRKPVTKSDATTEEKKEATKEIITELN